MATSEHTGGGGGVGAEKSKEARRGGISTRWLKTTQETNRAAFEFEMERQRQRFDGELQRFWRARHSPT